MLRNGRCVLRLVTRRLAEASAAICLGDTDTAIQQVLPMPSLTAHHPLTHIGLEMLFAAHTE